MLPFRNTLEEDRCKCCGEWFPFDQMDKGYCFDCMDNKIQEELEEQVYDSEEKEKTSEAVLPSNALRH